MHFCIEAAVYRAYYILMALLILIVFFILKELHVHLSNKNFLIIHVLTLATVVFLSIVFVLQIASPDEYMMIISARDTTNMGREYDIDAVSVIMNVLGTNSNYGLFCANYILNILRMLFPIELLRIGLGYLPFVGYQTYISYRLITYREAINFNENGLWVSIVIAFILLSVIFEPDFGSYVRHESVLTLIILVLFLDRPSWQRGQRDEVQRVSRVGA